MGNVLIHFDCLVFSQNECIGLPMHSTLWGQRHFYVVVTVKMVTRFSITGEIKNKEKQRANNVILVGFAVLF
ncbi:hypothetical protein EF878_07975 [Dickeya undicola]|uniref:Uncharacterized protein n=1 Tax=Dickeya undicola TaxID=1577887 RepID=A0A3N0G2T7_9GAMM|nr:hypothetical protein EF878_07975 [Dickeya undicola]